jgi:hypothetical protein
MWNRCVQNFLALGLIALGVAGCGGSGGGGQPLVPNPPPTLTYSVGGSVTGSTGAVALRNSNGDTLNVASAGTFSFGTAVVSGTAYAVTVTTPPAGQVCTVTNGSGNVGTSSVTNILVSCVTPGITVGGVVAGLAAGRSVTLQVLGDGVSEMLTVNANGRYDFVHNFTPAAEYLVLVQTQPLAQTCTVANSEGALTGASVVNVIVTCVDTTSTGREWTLPAAVLAPLGEPPTSQVGLTRPRIAFDAAGNGIAVWNHDITGSVSRVYWSRYTPAGGWTAPAALTPPPEFPNPGTYRDPEIAMSANGRAIVTVRRASAAQLDVMFYTPGSGPGSGWSDSEWLDVYVSGATVMIALDTEVRPFIDDAGNALVVWEQEIRPVVGGIGGEDPPTTPPAAFSRSIVYNRYTPGSGWASGFGDLDGGSIPVKQVLGVFQQMPQLAVNASGQAIVTWVEYAPGAYQLQDHWSREFNMTTNTWGPAQLVETANSWIQHQTAVVMDNTGAATAFWLDVEGDPDSVNARLVIKSNRSVNGVWGTPEIRESDNPDTRLRASYPQAVVDADGEVLAVWTQAGDEEGFYVAHRYTPGVGWRGETMIGEFFPRITDADRTRIVLRGNASGDAVAVWSKVQGIGPENVLLPNDVWANEYNGTTHEWGAQKLLDLQDTDDDNAVDFDYHAVEPDLAILPNGEAVAVWEMHGELEQDNGIVTSRYE